MPALNFITIFVRLPCCGDDLFKFPLESNSLCIVKRAFYRGCKTGCLTVREGNGCPLMRVSASEMWCLILRCFWPKRTALLLQPARTLQSVGEAAQSRDCRQQNVKFRPLRAIFRVASANSTNKGHRDSGADCPLRVILLS